MPGSARPPSSLESRFRHETRRNVNNKARVSGRPQAKQGDLIHSRVGRMESRVDPLAAAELWRRRSAVDLKAPSAPLNRQDGQGYERWIRRSAAEHNALWAWAWQSGQGASAQGC